MTDLQASPISLRTPPPYITRQPLYLANPTAFNANQWRQIAREPITKLCVSHIVRELVALEWEITTPNPTRDWEQIQALTTVMENADDGDGWDVWLARMVQDALMLPIGANAELAPDPISGMLGGLYHIDGATLYPTYDPDTPFVQINPFNGMERVYFIRGDLMRFIIQPRTDIMRKPYQEAPTESAFVAIEALSRIYIYYLKQLNDTPMAGILDLMDMTQEEAAEWAVNFREMLNGVDPLKIPVLYDHTKPAKFIPFGRTPQDINLMENFKRFAEMTASAFGLSISDLRLFEHDRVLAGVEASQRVTARSGIGFYAQAIEDMINRCILFSTKTGFKFKFKLGLTSEMQAEADLALKRIQMLSTLAGPTQALMKPEDAQKQLLAWKIVDVKLTGVPQPPGLEGLSDIMGGGGGGDTGAAPADDSGSDMGGGEEFKSLAAPIAVDESLFTETTVDLRKDELKKNLKSILSACFDQVETLPTSIDDWWLMPNADKEVYSALKSLYEISYIDSAAQVQRKAYELGVTNSFAAPMQSFKLDDVEIDNLLKSRAAQILQYVDDGTQYYLGQYQSHDDAQQSLFVDKSETSIRSKRLDSITSAEVAWVTGLADWSLLKKSGFTQKVWVPVAKSNNALDEAYSKLGPISVDEFYTDVFNERVQFPPVDPQQTASRLYPTDEEIKSFYFSNSSFWAGK